MTAKTHYYGGREKKSENADEAMVEFTRENMGEIIRNIFAREEAEITDEQVERVLAPVRKMIEAGFTDDRANIET